jgi:hypothetical protein
LEWLLIKTFMTNFYVFLSAAFATAYGRWPKFVRAEHLAKPKVKIAPTVQHCGHLHVLWRVYFGCWVTWSISSWQKYYKSVFFPKDEWWVAELLFLSLNNGGLNFLQNEMLSILSDLPFTRKIKNWDKCLLFNLANFWMIKLTKTSILPNCQVPNSCFLYNCKFYHSKTALGKHTWPERI